MLEKTLLDQLESLSSSQRLELISHVWELLDSEGLPLNDADTVILDAPIEERGRAPRDRSTRSRPSTASSQGSSPPARA